MLPPEHGHNMEIRPERRESGLYGPDRCDPTAPRAQAIRKERPFLPRFRLTDLNVQRGNRATSGTVDLGPFALIPQALQCNQTFGFTAAVRDTKARLLSCRLAVA